MNAETKEEFVASISDIIDKHIVILNLLREELSSEKTDADFLIVNNEALLNALDALVPITKLIIIRNNQYKH